VSIRGTDGKKEIKREGMREWEGEKNEKRGGKSKKDKKEGESLRKG
jgi:hypothetical protein